MIVEKNSGGEQRIRSAFSITREASRAALMPYFTLGYPDATRSTAIVEAIAAAGADLIELGIPFSDPLADGPTIQYSTQAALRGGMNVRGCLNIVASLRGRGVSQPLLLMGYANPILAYGSARFVQDASSAGADGLIIPDLPPEEAGDFEQRCRAANLALVYLLPPMASAERARFVAARSTGFLYLVSLTGVTGARRTLPPDLEEFILRARQETELPLAVGFGISTPEQARMVAAFADGVIVGSALIDAVREAADPVEAAGEFVSRLAEGLRPGKVKRPGRIAEAR
jgi:tryptophan synthase alpha chain